MGPTTSNAHVRNALSKWTGTASGVNAMLYANARPELAAAKYTSATDKYVAAKYAVPVSASSTSALKYASYEGPAIKYISGPPAVDVSTKSKTDVELVVDVIMTDAPVTEKISSIMTSISTKHPNIDKQSLLSRTYAAIWQNARPLIFSLVTATILAIGIAVVQTYFAGGSWLSLLEILRNLGVKVLPGVVFKILKGAGVSLGSSASINVAIALAEKNATVARLLNRQVKPAFLLATLRTIGIDISNYNLSVKNIVRTAIANGAAAGAGDINSFLINAGIKAGITASSTVAAKAKEGMVKTVKILEKVVKETVDVVMPDDVEVEIETIEETDAIGIARKVEKKVLGKNVVPVHIREPEVSKTIKEMLDDNKALVAGSTAALTLIGLAFTTDVSAVAETFTTLGETLGMKIAPELLNLAKKAGINYAWENAAARSTVFTILANQVGIQKLVDSMVDFLTPEQLIKIKSLDATLKRETRGTRLARNSKLAEFFSTIIGEQIYQRSQLERFDMTRLKDIARVKNIKFPTGVAKESLVEAIDKDQRHRLNNISQLVAQSVMGAIKQTTTLTAMEFAYQNLSFANLTTLKEVDRELEWNREMKQKQDTLAAEKTQAREQRRAKMAPVYQERQEAAFAAKVAAKAAVMEKAASKIAARELREAAHLQQLSKSMNIVITDPQGQSYAIPVDDLLLDPRLQHVLKDMTFTPLAKYLAMETAKSSLNWVPGLGYVNQAINSANWFMDVTEKLKDVYKVTNVALEIVNGESKIDAGAKNIETLDWLLKKRLPSLTDAVDRLVQLEKVNMKTLLLETLRDKILYQWDNDKVAYEIGKKIIGKEAVGLAESTLLNIGREMWRSVSVGGDASVGLG